MSSGSDRYDNRNHNHRSYYRNDDDRYSSSYSSNHPRRRDRSRSRSRSPPPVDSTAATMAAATSNPSKSRDLALERSVRMARLRKENAEEERRLAVLDREEATQRQKEAREQRDSRRAQTEILTVNPGELEGLEEEEQMRKLLGFAGGFGTTKGQAVESNQTTAAKGAAAKNKARKYRQYMNRKGGFNRPLDKMN